MHHEIDGFANFDSFAPYGDDIVLVIDASDTLLPFTVTAPERSSFFTEEREPKPP